MDFPCSLVDEVIKGKEPNENMSIHDFSQDEYELDVELLSNTRDTGDLGDVSNLQDALNRHGFEIDDNIPRRELVLIYHQTKNNIRNAMNSAARNGQYERANILKGRLNGLRQDYDNRQKALIQRNIQTQERYFLQAEEVIKHKLKEMQHQDAKNLRDTCFKKEIDFRDTFTIKKDKLNEKLSTTFLKDSSDEFISSRDHYGTSSRPTTRENTARPAGIKYRYSKRMIELLKAEHYLNELCQYDDAKRVRLMIDKLKPKEEEEYYINNYVKKIERLEANLMKEEKTERLKLDESIKRLEWKNFRQKELQTNM